MLDGHRPSGPLRFGLEIAAIRPSALALIDEIDEVIRADTATG